MYIAHVVKSISNALSDYFYVWIKRQTANGLEHF